MLYAVNVTLSWHLVFIALLGTVSALNFECLFVGNILLLAALKITTGMLLPVHVLMACFYFVGEGMLLEQYVPFLLFLQDCIILVFLFVMMLTVIIQLSEPERLSYTEANYPSLVFLHIFEVP